jgi:hypothetical protein
MTEVEKSKWYWIGRLRVCLDMYDDKIVSNQNLMSELIKLYKLLEEEEEDKRLKEKSKTK